MSPSLVVEDRRNLNDRGRHCRGMDKRTEGRLRRDNVRRSAERMGNGDGDEDGDRRCPLARIPTRMVGV